MIVQKSLCVSCPAPLPCLGTACPHHSAAVAVCDLCGRTDDEARLYRVRGRDLCARCARRAADTKRQKGAFL